MNIWDFDKSYKRKPNIKIGDLIINVSINPNITELVLSKLDEDTFITNAADNHNRLLVIKCSNKWYLDYSLRKEV